MNKKTDVAVVGGGPVGLLAALALADLQLQVRLFEARPEIRSGSTRLFALNAPAVRLLRQLGVWNRLVSAAAVRTMRIHTPLGGRMEIASSKAGRGSICHMVEEADLLDAAAALVADRGIAVATGAKLQAIEHRQDAVAISFGDSSSQASLLVGADGANSLVARLAGLEGYSADLPHSVVAAQAMAPGLRGLVAQWFAGDEIYAVLSGSGGKTNLIRFVPRARQKAALELDDGAFVADFARVCGADFMRIASVGKRMGAPLREHCRSCTAQRIVLLGDSAHCVHPLAGQGLAVGLGSVARLAEAVDRGDPGSRQALERFRRSRWLRAAGTVAATGAIARLAGAEGLASTALELAGRLPAGWIMARLANEP